MSYTISKRLADLVLALALLALVFPILALIALIILASDGRPVLFRQVRIGLHGRPFRIYKFRTLRPGAHDPVRPHLYTTRSGNFLRRWGLDELPQLWNVLQGDMSLVGPRPTIPEQVDCYGPFERLRLNVRPGLTGWAQIHGRNALDWPERIQLDVWYVMHRSLWLDLRILLATPRLLLSGHGTVGKGGVNADFVRKEKAYA